MPMFDDDKKKIATLIVSRIGGDSNREEMGRKRMNEGAETDAEIAMESAADELIDAVRNGDSKRLSSVLRSFIEMARETDEMEESEDERSLS